MANREQFEDHCWKDVIPSEDLATYSTYARDTRIGSSPALLAVDLYNLVYKGGAGLPHELEPDYPNSCGVYAHNAIEPTKALFAAARAADVPLSRIGSVTPGSGVCVIGPDGGEMMLERGGYRHF